MARAWKTVKPLVMWTVATGIGIGVSWLGIRPVLNAAAPDRPVAFPITVTAPDTTDTPAPTTSPSPAVPTVSAQPTPSRTGSKPTASGPVAAPPPPVTPEGWTPVGPGRYVRSFRLLGGNATVGAGHGVVELMSATPNLTYAMTVNSGSGDHVNVDFTGLLHTSTLDVAWVGDGPVVRITE